jgi:hypothetical protein
MGFGVKVWDSGGNVVFDETTRLFTFLGRVNYTCTGTGPWSGTVTDSNFAQGVPFFFVNSVPKAWVLVDDGMGGTIPQATLADITVSISGNVLSWSCDGFANVDSFIQSQIKITYGYV